MPALIQPIRNAFSHWVAMGVMYSIGVVAVLAGLFFATLGVEHLLAARVGPNAIFIVAASLLFLGAAVFLVVRAQARPVSASLKRISRRAQMAIPDRAAIEGGIKETLTAPSVSIAALLGGGLVFAATKLLEQMRSMEPRYQILPPVSPRRYFGETSSRDAAEALLAALNRDARSISQRTYETASETAPQIGQFATRTAKWLADAAIAEGKALRDSDLLERFWPRRSRSSRAPALLDVIPSTRQGLMLAAAALAVAYFVQKASR